ncbi:MAG: CHRD domain-containing protein, partial [Bacteroidales bacterium]
TLKQFILVILIVLGISYHGQATVYTLDLALSGQNEVPANPSTATGILIGTYDAATSVLDFNVMFNGLAGITTIAHFHGPAAAGINAAAQIELAGFPLGVTSGAYSNSYILTAEQESQLLSGLWYLNIHTTAYPGGELRGQLTEGTLTGECNFADIPLANWALLFSGLLIVAWTIILILRSR